MGLLLLQALNYVHITIVIGSKHWPTVLLQTMLILIEPFDELQNSTLRALNYDYFDRRWTLTQSRRELFLNSNWYLWTYVVSEIKQLLVVSLMSLVWVPKFGSNYRKTAEFGLKFDWSYSGWDRFKLILGFWFRVIHDLLVWFDLVSEVLFDYKFWSSTFPTYRPKVN